MATTAKRTSDGSRPRWSGLLDALLGRVPDRQAGFFRRGKDEPAADEQASDEQAAGEQASDAQHAHSGDEHSHDGEHLDQSSEANADAAPDASTKSSDDEGESSGLQVHGERVSLDAQLGLGAVDGVWWPRSDRAEDEVGELIEALPDGLGRVLRIALSKDDWSEDQPRVVQVGDRPLHLAWFDVMRRHTADVIFEDQERAVLLVLPTSTEESAAREVLEAVGQERSREDLLGKAGIDLQQGAVDTSAQDEQPPDGESAGAV